MQKAVSEGGQLCIYAKDGATFDDSPPICGKVLRRVPTNGDIILTEDIIDNNPSTKSISIRSKLYPLNGYYFITHDDNNYIFTYDNDNEFNKFITRHIEEKRQQIVKIPKTEVLLLIPGYGKIQRNILSDRSKYMDEWFSNDDKMKRFLNKYKITNKFLKELGKTKPGSDKPLITKGVNQQDNRIDIMFKGKSDSLANADVFFIVENIMTIIGKLRIPGGADNLPDNDEIPTNIEYLVPSNTMFRKNTNWKKMTQSGGKRRNMRTKRSTRRKYSAR